MQHNELTGKVTDKSTKQVPASHKVLTAVNTAFWVMTLGKVTCRI